MCCLQKEQQKTTKTGAQIQPRWLDEWFRVLQTRGTTCMNWSRGRLLSVFEALKCSILPALYTALRPSFRGGGKGGSIKIIDKDIKRARVSADTYLLTLQVAAGAGAAEA